MMKKKLNCILLIDDNHADNYFHKIVIEKLNITERIEVALDGVEALNFLKQESKTPPELIFLDINMPKIDGWGFLESYKGLSLKQKQSIIIVMLSTSDNPKDLEKARQIEEVSGFKVKPLTEEMLTEILEKHFPDYLR
jgi:CheY-like chemotaxis protein